MTTQKASAAPEPAAMPEAVATPKHVTTPQPVMTPETVAAWSSAAKAEQEQPADRRRRRTGWSLPHRSSRLEDQGRCLAMPAIRQEQVRERRFRRSRERRFRQSDTTAAVRCSRSTRAASKTATNAAAAAANAPRRGPPRCDPGDADPSASLGRCELQGERGEFREGLVELLELIERGAGVGPLARSDGVSRCLEAPLESGARARAARIAHTPSIETRGRFWPLRLAGAPSSDTGTRRGSAR